MFEKLLAILPYNPSLIHQVAFYGQRMREEASIRRTGLIFMVLAFFIQFFAVLSPPQASVAAGPNDLLNGGFSSAADAKAKCDANQQGFSSIMNFYDISCDAIGKGEEVVGGIHGHSKTENYYSMGREPMGQIHNGKATSETPVSISGQPTLYLRKMTIWSQNEWRALRIYASDGTRYYLLFDCGNLVSRGLPTMLVGTFTGSTGGLAPAPAAPAPAAPAAPVAPAPALVPTPVPTATPPGPAPPPTPPPVTAPCDKDVSSSNPYACMELRKTAQNFTTKLFSAHGSTAKAGDVINYRLIAENKGTKAVKEFTFSESLSDVLDYADVINLHGGSLSADKIVSWPTESIKAGKAIVHEVTVKVKDPIPQTPTSTSDPTHFDLIMTNVYGTTVSIKLPGSPIKQIEVATTTTLPKTGPGTSLAIAAAVVMMAGYFYGRARLLSQESEIAIKETTS